MNSSSRLTCKSGLRLIATVGFALLLTNVAVAQDQEAEGMCFSGKTAVVRGFIGGEAHDSYEFHVKAGRKVTVTITSQGNHASFSVSNAEFGEPVSFGKDSNGGRTWTGTIPETGVYFISVIAHPQARYTLRVTKE
jgi:plastocyanin